ncbi:MAG: DNA cytosine methyltransferase, partial [Bacteroidales bacterium]|nr:DNA cytosine methyltransferase [Bacteroidales bacterium]
MGATGDEGEKKMIKILLGGSPCTHWSIAQKNNRETKPEGLGWELFKNYLIAKEKFKPDFFLYENNKSAAQPIKDQISQELGVDLMYINSALVSAQNRQRFYAFNWEVEQPEDRGILLRDILETGVTDRDKARCVTASVGRTTHREYFMKQQNTVGIEPVDLTGNDKSYALTTTYGCCVPHDTLNRKRRNMIVEPLGVGYRGRIEEGKWKKRYESSGEPKANALTTALTDSMVAEPVRMPEYGSSDKARPLGAYYSNNCGGFEHRMFSENPSKQQVDMIAEPVGTTKDGKSYCLSANYANGSGEKIGNYAAHTLTKGCKSMVAEPIRVGSLPRPNGEMSTSQAKRIYAIDGKSVNLTALGGGEGAKTGLYAIPAQYPYALPIEWCEKGKPTKAVSGADGKTYIVYEVRDGIITIKDKQYPIKLPDGFYIIRKLTPVECERLQTLPDGYTRAVSNAQRYKGLGNGWTAEVIIHILNGALKDVPRDEEIVVLSMYDGIGTGRY